MGNSKEYIETRWIPPMDFEQKIFQRLDKTPRVRSEIRVVTKPKTSSFYVKREDRYNYVKYRLAAMKPYFLELLGMEKFESTNHVSSSSFYTYGIIVSPSGCKLDPFNIFISSSIDDSNDVIVRLNVNHLQKYSIFPGQVVAVKGKNLTGSEIMVEVLHCMPILDVNTIYPMEDKEKQYLAPTIIASSGPYGSESGFSILDSALGNSADVLILVGPFVNRVQEATGHSPMSVLNEAFIPKIKGWLERNVRSKIILVPSIGDLTCLNVFPQSPMTIEHSRVYCIENPGEFFLNGHLVAVSSLDTPLELSSEECFYDSGVEDKKDICGELLFQSDRISRISNHLVFQRTFLPVFPSVSTVSYSVPETMSMDIAPDIYIVTSKLKYFSREAGPSLVVNLGSQPKSANKMLCHIKFPGFEDSEAKPIAEFCSLQ